MEPGRLSEFLKNSGFQDRFELEAVRKEASARTYHRVRFTESDFSPLILCTGLDPVSETYRDFVSLTRFFAKHKVSAPELLAESPEGWLLLSDGGPTELSHVLLDAIQRKDTERTRQYVARAIDLMIQIHRLPLEPPVSVRSFDKEKLQWEMDFLFQRIDSITEKSGTDLPYTFEFRMFTYEVCALLGAEKPMVFTHRDYHSRNLLLPGDQMMVIDYQDARTGLPWYDLASLLYDPYVPLSPADRRFGFDYYCEQSAVEPRWNLFLLQAAQRILKALGTYLFMTFEKRHTNYAQSIPEGLDRLEEIIQKAKLPDSAFVFQNNVRKILPKWLENL